MIHCGDPSWEQPKEKKKVPYNCNFRPPQVFNKLCEQQKCLSSQCAEGIKNVTRLMYLFATKRESQYTQVGLFLYEIINFTYSI